MFRRMSLTRCPRLRALTLRRPWSSRVAQSPTTISASTRCSHRRCSRVAPSVVISGEHRVSIPSHQFRSITSVVVKLLVKCIYNVWANTWCIKQSVVHCYDNDILCPDSRDKLELVRLALVVVEEAVISLTTVTMISTARLCAHNINVTPLHNRALSALSENIVHWNILLSSELLIKMRSLNFCFKWGKTIPLLVRSLWCELATI